MDMKHCIAILLLNRTRFVLLTAVLSLVLTGYSHAGEDRECAPETALLWLRLGIAVGQNNDAPTTEELMTLLASIEEKQSLERYHYEVEPGISSPTVPTDRMQGDKNEMLASIADETFWIRLGNPTAPLVYMIIDPTCPFCSQGLQKLASHVSSGDLQIRIVLAPFLREEATTLAAELILADNPAEAIWHHEIIMQGQVDLAALANNRQIVDELGERGLRWLHANLEWMRKRQLNSVPLYVWAEGESAEEISWQIQSGVQEPGMFKTTLPPLVPTEDSFGLPREIQSPASQSTESFLTGTPLPLDP